MSDDGAALLDVRDLHVSYGAVKAVRGISFDVRPGEIVTLIGSNGAGKSTTLAAIVGLAHTQQGSITYQGRNVANRPTHEIVNSGIALAPEGRRIFLNLTVKENLELGALATQDKAVRHSLAAEVYELFPRIKERLRQTAGTLSGGEQQMLAVGAGDDAEPAPAAAR